MKILVFSLFLLSISFAKELITPIPTVVNYDKQKAQLGKKLFFDPILSRDGTISCASCHDLEAGGDDGLSFSVGVDGQIGIINSPTVLNSRYNFVQFWNGRVKTLKEQVIIPVLNPIEMGSKSSDILNKLDNNATYKKHFEVLYLDGISMDNVADAIAEFEKALVTPDSRFDKYLRGDKNAITKDEKQGYSLFKSLGCISCHNGVNIGGNIYQKMGIFAPIRSNLGRYEVTKDESDKYFIKVPTLRNISKTAPYFHDGSENDLKNAIKKMADYQLGRSISEVQLDLLFKFLLTLDGKKPKVLDEK